MATKSKIWVLDTETKGTGARVVPLDTVQKKPEPKSEPIFVPPKRRPKPVPEPVPRPPRSFRVVDILSRELLADGANVRETLALLGTVRSIVDVNVHVWEPAEQTWRLLSHSELQLLWERRTQAG